MGTTCACHKHREMVPIEIHHIWPLGMDGSDTKENKVSLCANAHGAIHGYLDLLLKHEGRVPWFKARVYGRVVRAYAMLGYINSRPK